ncbi:hypothetical protein [Streptomyces sp. Ru71]|uniref:hypothetical protein n=1 Tax=Streptomyces sp. Ru71 TaxID=2080746 RepID=UPI0011B04EB4|nr:hypothetical protein [Streptomyces sp. Ru71]
MTDPIGPSDPAGSDASAEDSRLRYYPDLVENGGLRPAILAIAGGRRTQLGVPTAEPTPSASPWGTAEFSSPRGAMRVVLGYGVRRFAVSLDGQGHVWASGSTTDLSQVVDVLVAWRQGAGLRELAERFPFMEPGRLSQAYEDGNPVQAQWDAVIGDDAFRMYREVLLALREQAGLRTFFPYVSHWTLHLDQDPQDAEAQEILMRPVTDGEGFVVWSSDAPERQREVRALDDVVRTVLSLAGEL